MEAATTMSKGRLTARKQGTCADDVCRDRTGRSLQKQISVGGREHLEMPASQWWRSSASACPGRALALSVIAGISSLPYTLLLV